MRHGILGSIGVALFAAAWGCSSGEDGAGGAGGAGGTGTGTGGAAEGGGGQGGQGGQGGGGGEASGSFTVACTLAAQGLAVSTRVGTTPAIAWMGDGFAVAWKDLGADGGDIRLATLDADGSPQREVVIAGGPSISSHPSIHQDGDGLLVLWEDTNGTGSLVRGRRVARDGTPQSSAFTITSSAATEAWPIGAGSRSGAALAWMDATRAMLGFLDGSRLNGSVVPVNQARFPSVAADGEKLALAWAQGNAVGFARPTPGGASLRPVLHEGASANMTRVALGGDDAFIAWEDTRNGAEQIRLLRVSPQDELSSEALVTQAEGSSNWPALAWTGRGLAVAYYQFRERAPGVFVTLLGPDLAPRGDDLEVSGDAPARFPAVAWTGQELAVAYAETDRGIRLSRVICR